MFAANLDKSSQVSFEHAKATNQSLSRPIVSYSVRKAVRKKIGFLTGAVSGCCELRKSFDQRSVLKKADARCFVGRTAPRAHDLARFTLTQTILLQRLHRFLSLRRPQPFFRIRLSIASTLSVSLAMIRCICAFSASSSLRRTTSASSIPLYFDFQSRIVFA